MVLAGIAVMLLATGYLAIRSHTHELARVRLREGLAAGQSALESDELSEARSHFAVAAAAVETLGTDDAMSRLVRQLHQETTAMTSLAPGSMFEMLEEGERALAQPGSVNWEGVFASRYEGTWFILQAPVRRVDDSYELDFPVTVGEDRRPVRVHADLGDFKRLQFDQDTVIALFAAPIIRCALDQAQAQWDVILDGEKGFLWSEAANLRRLGFFESHWVDEDDIAELLSAQRDVLEKSP
jgi:hypothetical protein